MNKLRVVAALNAIAGLAASAAQDVQDGRLWPGDLSNLVSQIHQQLQAVSREMGDDR